MYKFLSKHRIRHASEYTDVLKRGERFNTSCFSLSFLKTTHTFSRLGIVISKKNCALAVDRNHIKRVIREQFRLNQAAFSSVDVVVMLKSSTQKLSAEEQGECIKKLFSQLIVRCALPVSN